MWRCELVSTISGQGPIDGFYEDGNKPSLHKRGELFDQLSSRKRFKKIPTPGS